MRLQWPDDYERLVMKKSHSWDDSKAILDYLRANRVFQPDVTVIHGSKLLARNPSKLGDDVWAVQRSQGKTKDAIEAAITYLNTFQMDKEVWHELSELYLQDGLYTVLTYAEIVFSMGQDYDLARKYFCLACEIDETNTRALWGLFWCNQQLYKKDQGSDKMLQLQTMTVQRLRNVYKPLKHVPATGIMLKMLDAELAATARSCAPDFIASFVDENKSPVRGLRIEYIWGQATGKIRIETMRAFLRRFVVLLAACQSPARAEPPVWLLSHTAVYHIDRLWDSAVRALWPFRDMGEADGVYVLYRCFLGYLRHFLSLAHLDGGGKVAAAGEGYLAEEEYVYGSNQSRERTRFEELLWVISSPGGEISVPAPAAREDVDQLRETVIKNTAGMAAGIDAGAVLHTLGELEEVARALGGDQEVLGFGGSSPVARGSNFDVANATAALLFGAAESKVTTLDPGNNALASANLEDSDFGASERTSVRQKLQATLERIQAVLNYFLMQVFSKRQTTQGTVLGWSRSLLNPGRSLNDPQRLSFFSTFLRSERRIPLLYNPLLPECFSSKLVPEAQPAFDVVRYLREEIGTHKLSHQFIAIRPERLDMDPEIGQILKQAIKEYFGEEELHAVLAAEGDESGCPRFGAGSDAAVVPTTASAPPSPGHGHGSFNDPLALDRTLSAASFLVDFSRCLQADSRFSGTVERTAPYSRSKYVEQISGADTAAPLMLKANCSVFDAFPTTSPDLLFLHPKAGNAGYLMPRIFSRRMGPTQPFPKLVIVPFNPNFGATQKRRPLFLKKQLSQLGDLWSAAKEATVLSSSAGLAEGAESLANPDDEPDPLTVAHSEFLTVTSDREEIELRLHWHRAREREIWETQWSLAAIVDLLKKRYTLVRVVFGFAVFQLSTLLSDDARRKLGLGSNDALVGGKIASNGGKVMDSDFGQATKKSTAVAFGQVESSVERLWREGWYCHPLSYRLLDGYFATRREMGESSGLAGKDMGPRMRDRALAERAVQTGDDTFNVVEFPERPGFAYLLQRSKRGRCHHELGLCECFPPYHGLLCENVDSVRGKVDVVYATTTPAHNLDELIRLPLNTLKNLSPSAFDAVPLVVFHDAPLNGEQKQAIQKGAWPIRVWFSYLNDWTPETARYHDLSRSEASLGYRHQCRWKSGPMFREPALREYKFLFFFDTDSAFPKIELKGAGGAGEGEQTLAFDYLGATVERMRNEQHVYAYVHRTREKDSMVAYLWDYTKLYLADHSKRPPSEDVDHVSLFNELPPEHQALFARSIGLREAVAEKISEQRRSGERMRSKKTTVVTEEGEEQTRDVLGALLSDPGFAKRHLAADLSAVSAEADLESFLRNNTHLYRWNRHVYMTDLEIMYMPWFRADKVYDYFHYVDSLHGWYTDRWGDHAFRTMQLKLFLGDAWDGKTNGVLQLKEFPYTHQRFCSGAGVAEAKAGSGDSSAADLDSDAIDDLIAPLKQYFLRYMRHPQPASMETNRVTLLFFCVASLDLLGHAFSASETAEIRDFVHKSPSCRFEVACEGSAVAADPQMQMNADDEEEEDPLEPRSVANIFSGLMILRVLASQEAADLDSDVRFSYCAAVIATVLNLWEFVDRAKMREYVLSCRARCGAYGIAPWCEAHGGATFCAVACLELSKGRIPAPGADDVASSVSESDEGEPLRRWLSERQRLGPLPSEKAAPCDFINHGGFQGRVGKHSDCCYTFWEGGALALLGCEIPDKAACLAFLKRCFSKKMGGFKKHPTHAMPDPLHTWASICGLSLCGYGGVKKLDPRFGTAKH
eukprot:g6808.t1